MTNRVESLSSSVAVPAHASRGRAIRAVAAGTAVVALSAQVAVPVPFTPVPMTLQPLAVLIVGGLLGPALGGAALVSYLALGLMGFPVFAAGGSAERLIGPTGGYLLSYPVVAAVVGTLVRRAPTSAVNVVLAAALGMVLIHIGGAAQLMLLTGTAASAVQAGVVPFLTGDLLKIGIAAIVVLVGGPKLRSLL
jgi:biotin transport system substrate-specific component